MGEGEASLIGFNNSLEATDAAIVHAGYAKRRKALLEAGIALYELRSGARQIKGQL